MVDPMKAALVLCASLFCAIATPGDAHAGACTEEDSDAGYVRLLERLAAPGKRPAGDDPFFCLKLPLGMTNRWAGPIAARKFARYRRSPLRPRIARACAKIIARGRFDEARACVELLAWYAIPRAGRFSTFALQRRYFADGLGPGPLTALADPRAVPQLITRFSASRACHFSREGKKSKVKRCLDFVKGKRNRWTRKAQREHKIAVLNALWHFADPRSRAFLEKVAKDDPSKLVRERAAHSLRRVMGKR